MDVEQFKSAIEHKKCPFCHTSLTYYDGAMGYEAMECKDCNLTIDVNGIHLD